MTRVEFGEGVGRAPVAGPARVLHTRADYPSLHDGDIAVVGTPDTELVLWLDRLAGIVCLTGTAESHLAMLAAEADVPCLMLRSVGEEIVDGCQLVLDPAVGELRIAQA
ncbi:PEP-utilizing enzyme [Micromonospora zamorensis]|uniref:PEP-utilizing enzyme n=1 Tax=Micromonospora zamorensis TaxID=709883 RepID=UPI0034056DEF